MPLSSFILSVILTLTLTEQRSWPGRRNERSQGHLWLDR